MVAQRDYSEELVKAARSVLLELVHLLGEYWNHIVLIGGWVPELLVGSKESPHCKVDSNKAFTHQTSLRRKGGISGEANCSEVGRNTGRLGHLTQGSPPALES
ncbi:MAG: hypothetical protein HY787_28790 [Deltaproteobacteria bacterium]|nr:hypothetical protein [Deltaproteobacteria bacterium]